MTCAGYRFHSLKLQKNLGISSKGYSISQLLTALSITVIRVTSLSMCPIYSLMKLHSNSTRTD